MSHAFTREEDDQWLHDLPPTFGALVNYLSRENNGVDVYEKGSHNDPETGKMVYHMSNGLYYTIGNDGKWTIAA